MTDKQVAPAFPPGHFYSPVVDTVELERRRAQVFNRDRKPSDVDLREEAQLAFLHKMKPHYDRLPFSSEKSPSLRYFYENPMFGYGDAITLACMLMEARPRRIVEIGSGYSSCVMMDVNELFLGGETAISFVEPHPCVLFELMKPGDRDKHPVIASPVQEIDLTTIEALSAGDVLFIDSTHVSKCGSDVNFEVFTILPRLASGTYIHIHDMFYPFEYPEAWFFEENRSWNELYLVHAFLAKNTAYEIVFFNDFMAREHRAEISALMPLFCKNTGGSLWLRKR